MGQNKAKLPMTKETMAVVVAERYQADENFRNSFDRDPKATILKHFDIAREEWPSNMELTILRNDDQCVHIGIPILKPDNVEIPDSVMMNISGGYGGDPDPWAGYVIHPFMAAPGASSWY